MFETSGADVEFRVGLGKDPSVDRILDDIPRDAERKLGARMRKVLSGVDTAFQDVFRRAGRLATSVFSAAGIGGAGYELKAIANIDRSLHQLARAGELTAVQEKALGLAIKQTAADSGTARDEQVAALQMLQDRYAVVNRLAAEGTLEQQLELAAKVAKGFGMTLHDSVNLMGALNKMADLTGDKLTETMAFLEKASQMGSMGFKELGSVLPELLGEAGAFGQKGESAVRDVAALLEATTSTVQDTERARTYVRGFISRLGSSEVGEKLKKNLGVVTTDASGSFRRLSDIVLETMGALEKLSDSQRSAQMKDIFGSEESIAVLKALSGKGGAAFKGILQVEAGSEQFLDYLEEQADSTAAQFERLAEQVRLVIDEGLEPLMKAIVDHGDSIKAVAKWVAANPLKTGFAVLFGPTAVKMLWSAVASKIAAGSTGGVIGKALTDGLKGTGAMNVEAGVVNVAGGGAGSLPGGGTASKVGSGLGIASKLMNWKTIALAGELGIPAGALLKMLGPAALAPGAAMAGMVGGSVAIGAGVAGFAALGVSDAQKRYGKGQAQNVWTRAESLDDEGREEFKKRYYELDEKDRVPQILNAILDELQAQTGKEQKVKVNLSVGSTTPDAPPVDYSVMGG